MAYALFWVWLLVDAFRTKAAGWDSPVSLICALALPSLSVICGWYILKGANWARLLFFGACIPAHLLFLATSGGPFVMIRLAAPFILGLFLISRSSNLFFTGRPRFFKVRPVDPQPPAPRPRKGRYDY